MNYSEQFAGLVDTPNVVGIEAASIPSPPSGKSSGEHLFVNCRYRGFVDDMDVEELLSRARSDVVTILKKSVGAGLLNKLPSICVSILGQLRSGAKRRIYRYAVESNSIPSDPTEINVDNLANLPGCLQGSEIDEIELLLSGRDVPGGIEGR
jgi:hypothetical protein